MANPGSDDPLPARSSTWKWGVCGLLLLATMLNYMDRLTLNLTARRIMSVFTLDELQYGYLESAFAYAFALGAIIFGWLADRINVRWLYAVAVIAWSAAGFGTGLVNGFVGLLVCRFLLGLAEAGNWPSALRTTQRILPASERSMGNSILQSGTSFGAILTPLIIMALVTDEPSSWRWPFLVIGAIGGAWVLLWLTSVRTADLALPPGKASSSLVSILGILFFLFALQLAGHLWTAGPAWLPLATTCLTTTVGIACVITWLFNATRDDIRLPRAVFIRRYCVLIVLVVSINITWHYLRAWLPLFLQTRHDFDDRSTQWFMLGYYILTDIGCLLAGFATLLLTRGGLSVHASRVAVFAVCALLTTLSVAVAFLPTGPLLMILLLVIGFAALGLFPNYYLFSQEITIQYQGKVTGSLGCINWLVMGLLHEVVGDSIKRTGSYSLAMSLAGLAPLLGVAAIALFWGTTQPRSEMLEEPSAEQARPGGDGEEHAGAPADQVCLSAPTSPLSPPEERGRG